jgi:hypothetical protein
MIFRSRFPGPGEPVGISLNGVLASPSLRASLV